MSYLVQYTNGGEDFFLRSIVFTFLHRATRFENETQAKEALQKASQFFRIKKTAKAWKIVQEENVVFASEKSAEYHKIIPGFV